MIRLNRAMVIAYWSTASGRAVSKTDLALDEWDKEITPSTELRKAFHGEVVDFATFASNILQNWRNTSKKESGWRTSPKTAADPALRSKNTTQNHALVLADWLRSL